MELEQLQEQATDLKQDLWMFLDDKNLLNVEIRSTMNYLLDLIDCLEEEI